ncbi:MAG: Crp/Fnr family transcriptional regulator [Gemmatimonadota bacterium]|nr:Crp/Fnr family transcriptional regulator [Gemmatimonadota bacterium]
MRQDALDHWLEALGLEGALTTEQHSELARHSALRDYRRAQVLWTAGSESKGLYVVTRGCIRVLRSRKGRQHLIHVSEVGATMGEVPLFDGRPYPATAIAATDAQCLVLSAASVRGLASDNGVFAALFMERLSTRVRTLVDRLERQTLGDVRSRLAASLVGASAVGTLAESGGADFDIGMTQEEWAEDLGTVREVLARELRAMKDDGLIEQLDRRRFRLLREDALEEIAGA